MDNVNEKLFSELDSIQQTVTAYKEGQQKEMTAILKDVTELKGKAGRFDASEAERQQLSEWVRELKAKGGRFAGGPVQRKSTRQLIADAIQENFDKIQNVGGKRTHQFEVKASLPTASDILADNERKAAAGNMTLAADLAGSSMASYMQAPAVRGRRKVILRDILGVINSATGNFHFYQQNIPVGVGSLGIQTEGQLKNQMEWQLTEVVVQCAYVARFTVFSKQMANNLPFLQTFLANEMIEEYRRTETAEFLPTLLSGATGSTTSAGANFAEQLTDYVANLLAGDYEADAIITNAAQWSALMKTAKTGTAADYSLPGGSTIDDNGDMRILGVPVKVSNNMPSGVHSLTGAFTKAAIIQNSGISLEFFEQEYDNIRKNNITCRVECFCGLGIFRPDAFIYV